jgi:WD40 repeat protein
LEVTANDSAPVHVPGAQERLLLAVLASRAPDPVPADRLVELLGDREALTAAVHRLRAALEPRLPERSSGQFVLRRGPGYALTVPRGDVDASRFTDLAVRGHARLEQDPRDAEWLLGTTLGLWRGEPYEEWPDAPFAEVERRRLVELRSRAEADLADARARVPVMAPRRISVVRRPELVPAPPISWTPAPVAAPVPVPRPRETLELAVATPRPGNRRPLALAVGLVVLLVAALSVARLSGRSEQQQTAQAARVADANRLAALSRNQTQLDLSLLMAAEAFRLAETPATRDALAQVLDGHGRVERAVSFYGVPQDAVLSGGRTLTFGVGVSVVGWPVGPATVPREILPIPSFWGEWKVAAPSPVDDVVLGAGTGMQGPWVRRVSTLDGTSRLLLEGGEVGGQPVAGAMSPDGRQLHLLLAQPEDADPRSSHWQVVDIDAQNGAVHDTGIHGVVGAPVGRVGAEFAEDAGSFVVWDDDTASPSGTLVHLADGRQVQIPVQPGTRGSSGFHAYSGGVLQFWDDGGLTLFDRDGHVRQEIGAVQKSVLDVAVAPDGRWAVTGGKDGEVFEWEIDPHTGRWYGRNALRGHTGDVVSVEVDAAGRLLATVSADHTAITWDMRIDGPRNGQGPATPETRLEVACAIAGRDLTAIEWHRVLPDRPWQPTCSDLT